MRYLIWSLGYLWSALTVIPGFLVYLLFRKFGWTEPSLWWGPTLLVYVPKGSVSAYFWRHGFYATTLGAVCFFWDPPSMEGMKHERRHVYQQLVLGPFQPLIYGISFLIGLIKYGSFWAAYRNNVLEKDARRVAGES